MTTMNTAATKTTEELETRFFGNQVLALIETDAYTVNINGGTYTVSFADTDAALAAVDEAGLAAWTRHMAKGHSGRNKAAHIDTWVGSIKQAIIAAA